MGDDLLTHIPDAHRDAVRTALADAIGPGVARIEPTSGGASGALTYRVDSERGSHLLRIEGVRGPLRNPHQTTCLQAAASAGIAPPVLHADDDTGLLLVDWLDTRPVAEHPEGPHGAAREAGELIAGLHALPRFPDTGDHLQKLQQLTALLPQIGRVAPGLLDPHAGALEELVAGFPWDPAAFVACHNDPNQGNLLFDGERLWLVDWETAGANDPVVDLASLAEHLAPTDELRDALLRAALGREPDEVDQARLVVGRQLGRALAGLLLLLVVADPDTPTHLDLDALTIEQFLARLGSGELVPGVPSTTLAFAKISLAQFLAGMETPETRHALRVLGA